MMFGGFTAAADRRFRALPARADDSAPRPAAPATTTAEAGA